MRPRIVRDSPRTGLRFLKRLGFDVVGVDIAADMLALARTADPAGDYQLVPDSDLAGLTAQSYDLVLAVFTFDNVPTLTGRSRFSDRCPVS